MSERRANPDGPGPGGALKLPLDVGIAGSPELPWKAPALVTVLLFVLGCADATRRTFWLAGAATALGAVVYAVSVVVLARRRGGAPKAWLVVDDEEITRVQSPTPSRADRRRTSLVRWGTPFGLSVLANAARTRVLLAFTTPTATRFLGLRLENARDADVARDVLERAVTVADVDLELAGPPADVQLGASSARTLLGEIDRRDPQALHRLYLSDTRGGAVVVEPDRLQVGAQSFDLGAPLDSRFFTFQEGDAGVAALYQATAVRQGASDVVLVCRAPEDLASWGASRASDVAPPRETRVAIDRLFMTPLRAMLEQAPRLSRPGVPSARARRPSEAR